MEEIVEAPGGSSRRTRTSPLMQLFAPNSTVGGAEVDLRKIRDLIYSYAWSRERRDDQKMDFIVSQWGINRNVPERFIPDTPYGTSAFQDPEKLRCNLHLVNKQISADFRRFIYSVNDLEIDIDLKPGATTQAETELQKIVDVLQNPNFLQYTQTVRVRIHFPSKYPINNLPACNRRALDNIACTLDQFRQLQYLTIRCVSAQEQGFDYELRFAAFPFYTMRMTRWSIRVYNPVTHNWDLVTGQQVQALDQAWELYQKTGNSYTAKHEGPTKNATSPRDNTVLLATQSVGGSNMNGSQKRKYRKGKTAHAVRDQNVSFKNDRKAIYVPAQLSAEPDSPVQTAEPLCASPSTPPISNTNLHPAEDSTSGDNDSRIAIDTPAVNPDNMAKAPPSPPVSPTKSRASHQISSNSPSSDASTAEVILTPSESLPDNSAFGSNCTLHSTTSNNRNGNKQSLETTRSPSPPLLSKSCYTNDEASSSSQSGHIHAEQHQTLDPSVTERSERSNTLRSKKNKRKSKKPKQLKATSVPESDQTVDNGMATSRGNNDKSLATANESKIALLIDGLSDVTADSNNVTLVTNQNARATTIVTLAEDDFNDLNHGQARTSTIFQHIQLQVRTRQQVEMRNRQNERRRAAAALLEAQKKETREKRAIKKAKALHLRRENVDTNSPLSRLVAARRESKPKTASKSSEITKPAENKLSSEWENINTQVTERSELKDWSTTETDISILEDRPYRFNFDDAIDRKVEEIVDEDPGEEHDEKLSHLSENHVHQADHVEDGRPDNVLDVPLDEGTEATPNMDVPDLKSTEPDVNADGSPNDFPTEIHLETGYKHDAAEETRTSSMLRRLGQQVMECAERRLKYPPGIPIPRQLNSEQADDAGGLTLSEIEAIERRRNKWVIAAAAADDELYARCKERQIRFEAQMEASGTGYSDYDIPIHDNWTKTDEDGKCLEKGGEVIVYDGRT